MDPPLLEEKDGGGEGGGGGDEVKVKGQARIWTQVLAASTACLGALSLGTSLAWTSPTLPRLQRDLCAEECDAPEVDASQGAWIGALLPLGAAIGSPMAGFLMSKFGKKWTIVLLSAVVFLGHALLLLATPLDSVAAVFAGRFVSGLSCGAFALASPLYVVDVSSPSLRGALSSLMPLMLTAGILAVNALSIGRLVHWQGITLLSSTIPVLVCAAMPWMPESPRHLLLVRRDREAAREAIAWLRGPCWDAAAELKAIEDEDASSSVSSVGLRTLFVDPRHSRPFFVVLVLMLLQQLSGINAVVFYAQTVFAHALSSDGGGHSHLPPLDPALCSTLVAAGQVLGGAVSLLAVEKVGRRPLFLFSEASVAATASVISYYFYVRENDDEEDSSSFALPVSALLAYVVTFQLGLGVLPWTLNAELIPAPLRPTASSLASSFNWTCAFAVTRLAPDAEAAFGASGLFLFFAASSAAGTAFAAAFLPETRGKTDAQIEKLFELSSGGNVVDA